MRLINCPICRRAIRLNLYRVHKAHHLQDQRELREAAQGIDKKHRPDVWKHVQPDYES